MEKYSIFCTQEQTKKALELGAPITHNGLDNTPLKIPTAEEMIGWLEEQGFFIRISSNGCMVLKGFEAILNLSSKPRKEATIAAIDAALEYLSNKK